MVSGRWIPQTLLGVGFLVVSIIGIRGLSTAPESTALAARQQAVGASGDARTFAPGLACDGCGAAPAAESMVVYDGLHSGLLCRPAGPGPFAAVMFNHGGTEGVVGGAPEETCRALQAAGYVGFSPIRTDGPSPTESLANVYDALEFLKALDYVNTQELALVGFSRGVMFTYDLATSESSGVDCVVLMAGGISAQAMNKLIAQDRDFSAPVLLLVAANDTPADLNGFQDMTQVVTALESTISQQGAPTDLIVYPAYSGGHGHTMFFEVGDYWTDVLAFLADHL